jgi:TetR/AcrR family transcriptional regulator
VSSPDARPRRSPRGAARVRDAERTRSAILDAALVEFGEHGFAGARTGAIARRAGVNAQLISYYFDGKEGLYRALSERFRGDTAPLHHHDRSLPEIVADFVRVNAGNRAMTRLMIWDGLTGSGEDGGGFYADLVADLERRRQTGEIPADLDPASLLLALFAAALAPTALPHVARQMTGLEPDTPEFVERYSSDLARLVERLLA